MAEKLCRSGIVSLYDVKGVSLIVLEYMYKGVLAEGRGSDKALVGCICNQADEVVDCLIDLLWREVRGRGVREGIKLVVSKHTLLLVMPLSKELAGVGNGGSVR